MGVVAGFRRVRLVAFRVECIIGIKRGCLSTDEPTDDMLRIRWRRNAVLAASGKPVEEGESAYGAEGKAGMGFVERCIAYAAVIRLEHGLALASCW